MITPPSICYSTIFLFLRTVQLPFNIQLQPSANMLTPAKQSAANLPTYYEKHRKKVHSAGSRGWMFVVLGKTCSLTCVVDVKTPQDERHYSSDFAPANLTLLLC